MKKVYINNVLCIVLCTVLLVCAWALPIRSLENPAKAADVFNSTINYNCSAQSACVIDADSHRVFYSKNDSLKLPMASTTKIVTAITAILNYDDLNTRQPIDNNAVGVEGSSIYLKKGEMLSLKELLYGLMLRSGNDAATAIAYMVAGGIPQFAKLMNDFALSVGAKNSHFTNPHGLDDPEHYTTAYDLALITSFALNNETFAEIVKTKNVKLCEDEDNYRYLVNKNKLLYNMPSCIGVKTGYTKKAGRCLVSASLQDGLKVVSVVLNCGPMFEESKDLLSLVHQKYKSVEIIPPYNYYNSVMVENGEQKIVNIYSREGLKLALSDDELCNINIEYDLPKTLVAPIESEKVVGSIKVYYGKHLIFSEKIYTMDSVKSRLLKDKVKDILDEWSL